MTQAQQPQAMSLSHECADFALSMRIATTSVIVTGNKPPESFLIAADLFERASTELDLKDARIADLEREKSLRLIAAPAEYPHLPTSVADVVDFSDGRGVDVDFSSPAPAGGASLYTADQMRAYVDADRTQRAAAPHSAGDFGRAALEQYLKECEENQIVPDVGGAFAYAWQRAAAPQAVQAVVPDGWKLVPTDPTEKMGQAASDYLGVCVKAWGLWEAMLAAAPAHPAEGVPAATVANLPADPTEEMIEVLMAGEDRLRARHGDELPKQRAKKRYHALLALAAAQPAAQAVPVLYVSKGQLDSHRDPDGVDTDGAGRYLPARKTPKGNFTAPLYEHPAPAAQGVDVQQYRLLDHGELIEAGDEFLRDDFTWQIDPKGLFVGCPLGRALRPARRAIATQTKQGGAA